MCGSTGAQNEIEGTQQSAYNTMNTEAQSVFGEDSALYKSLVASFLPTLEAGPNQKGFSDQQDTALNTQATEGTAQNYQNAEKAVRETGAAAGGGNDFVPNGQEAEESAQVAEAAAGQESTEENQITEANYALGETNYLDAAQGLMSAGNVYSSATSLDNAETGAGTAAANTANQIAQENQSWMGAVGGMVGTAAAGWAGGGFKMPS